MKVYIVTSGIYSDYTIERVFSNRPAAEEYKKWHNLHNDIEEYEIYNEPFTKEDGEKTMLIRVQGTVYPEAVVNIRYESHPHMIYEGTIRNGAGIMNYKKDGVFDVYCYRCIPADRWDEEKYKDRLTKVLYDYAAIAKLMFAEGANLDMVNLALIHKDDEMLIIAEEESDDNN